MTDGPRTEPHDPGPRPPMTRSARHAPPRILADLSAYPGQGFQSPTSIEVHDWAASTRTAWTSGIVTDPFTPAGKNTSTGRRTGPRVALAGFAAVTLLGGVGVGGYAAYEKVLGGGGPQPESAVPATALAFAKIDLDPSGSQKIDALRFARKFPSAPKDVGTDDADLRKLAVEGLQKQGQLAGLDYATDVGPWLGNRFAVALLPSQGNESPVPVIALAVTDQAKAEAALAKASSATHCNVGDTFALCAQEQSVVDGATAAAHTKSLSDDKDFAGDMASLGEDGIVAFWSDLGGLSAVTAGLSGASPLRPAPRTGRVVGALRFDAANLEVVARQSGVAGGTGGTRRTAVGDLPSDTLAAIGVTDGAARVKANGPTLSSQGAGADPLAGLEQQTGFKLPDDLATLLGSSFVVSFAGLAADGTPEIAMRTDSPAADVQRLVDKLSGLGPGAPRLTVTPAGSATMVTLGRSYAAKVTSGSGLGDSAAFKAAVPDAGRAQAVAYVDIAGLLAELGDDVSATERSVLEPIRAVGATARVDGDVATYRLRLTTK